MAPNYGEDVPYKVHEDNSSKDERRGYWVAASALQEADGLKTSEAAEERAGEYIAGHISSTDLAGSLADLHRSNEDGRQKEADIVAGRIVRLLELGNFSLTPRTLIEIHSSLFSGVFDASWVGRFREVNLSKEEAVLGGRSVQYCDWGGIFPTLEYDFGLEKSRQHTSLSDGVEIAKITRFIANVWQTHPFREGNTRTCAVFCELYLRSLGCKVDNEPFSENGKLFRDALVRANWSSIPLGIGEEPKFLQAFIDSIVNGAPFPYSTSDLNLHGVRETSLAYREDEPISLPIRHHNDSLDDSLAALAASEACQKPIAKHEEEVMGGLDTLDTADDAKDADELKARRPEKFGGEISNQVAGGLDDENPKLN